MLQTNKLRVLENIQKIIGYSTVFVVAIGLISQYIKYNIIPFTIFENLLLTGITLYITIDIIKYIKKKKKV